MQIITQILDKNTSYEKYFHGNRVCFLDIETTGLSRNYHSIYLVGLLYFENHQWKLQQIFADSLEEEKDLLLKLKSLLLPYDEIITYNGDSFDIPFINHRVSTYNISEIIPKDHSLDLYRLVRENKSILDLDNLKLKTLERFLGIYREDIYSGKECIDFYKDYLYSKDMNQANKVLKHNFDDLYYMLDILKILDIIEEIKTIKISHEELNLRLYIESCESKGDLFIVKGLFDENKDIKLIYYDHSYKITLDKGIFELILEYSLGLVSPTEKGLYIDKKKIALSDDLVDSTIYKVPSNIILLKVEDQVYIKNIKNIITDLINRTLF